MHRLLHSRMTLVVVLIAAFSGVLFGLWLSGRQDKTAQKQQVDEYFGLGKRTGLDGDLVLNAKPLLLSVQPGSPAVVNLSLTNKTSRNMVLNGWLTPSSAEAGNNQFPLKIRMTRSGQNAEYMGNGILMPPHTRKDFLDLGVGRTKDLSIDITKCAGGGRWNMSVPGRYTAEIWYETYLTGRSAGVNAWTGMSNHVIVQLDVVAVKGGSR